MMGFTEDEVRKMLTYYSTTSHFSHTVESWREGVVGANIEATGQVIHCYGADTSDKTAFDAGICSGFYFLKKAPTTPSRQDSTK